MNYPDRPAPVPQRIIPGTIVPVRNGVTVWWSNVKREGEWILPRNFRIFSFMGNTELDLELARMGDGVSEIEIRCIFGNVEITVPADIRVQCDGDGILGSFEVVRIGEVLPPEPGAPTLRVTGTAYMSSVTIKIMGKVGPRWQDRVKAKWQQLNAGS